MARIFLNGINLTKTELQNAQIQNLATAPSSPVLGQVYFDTAGAANVFRVWNGTIWVGLYLRLDQMTAPTASVDLNSQKIINLASPTLATDAASRGYVLGLKVTDLTAPTVDFSMNSLKITNLAAPLSGTDAATRGYVLGLKVTDLTAPTTDFNMNGLKITGLGTPTLTTDSTTKSYVDTAVENARQGISYKPPVKVALTTNVTLTGPGATLDGVTMAAADRFLVTNQTTGAENGIYTWTAAASAAVRAVDSDVFGEVQDGTQVYVQQGTDAEKVYRQTATIASFTGQVWAMVAAGSTYIAGAGLLNTAGTFDITTTAGSGITVGADTISVDTAVVARKYTVNVGDGAALTYTITHNLGTKSVASTVFRNSTPWDEIMVDNTRPTTNTVFLDFGAVAPTASQYTVLVVG